ncbi:GIY-YIG nuclease family protein [Nocardiopsis sp. B62]|uniref:GIY-YIG nuclease family protein n=1 Tax=Nocardiopsis sp. B62 TaxID=2824874 RepID=UPI001B3962EE|nr:GIY-YIG nuclease family protein [Nocardiopsis sp. B62]MBQ1083326.1 GIY-YIG nuclease family protein [Nocardiopsis sp. B62]
MESSNEIKKRVHQKWGFGMAPIKSKVHVERVAAARTLIAFLSGDRASILGRLDDISTVKGLFSRAFKKDQWDWFTVWSQLGYPKYREAREVAGALCALRRSLRDGDHEEERRKVSRLRSIGLSEALKGYADGSAPDISNDGFIYVLSTREMPDFLKIGYTNRDIFTRVREINSATGVVIPYGARGAWRVPRAKSVESDIHGLLSDFRIRKDREFFNVSFGVAAAKIEEYLKEN